MANLGIDPNTDAANQFITKQPLPNPMADMVREAIGAAIEETVRKVVREELAPVLELATTIEAFMENAKNTKNMFLKGLFPKDD